MDINTHNICNSIATENNQSSPTEYLSQTQHDRQIDTKI